MDIVEHLYRSPYVITHDHVNLMICCHDSKLCVSTIITFENSYYQSIIYNNSSNWPIYRMHWRIQRGGCGGCNPPLNFQKIVVIRVAVASCDIFSCYFIKQSVSVCVEWCCHWVLHSRHCNISLLFFSPWRGRVTNN